MGQQHETNGTCAKTKGFTVVRHRFPATLNHAATRQATAGSGFNQITRTGNFAGGMQ